MSFTERLALLISADVDGAIKGIEGVGKAADRDLGKAEQRIDKVGATMRSVGAGMLAAGGIAAAGLFKAGRAASDLNEAINVTGLVFGDSRGEIDRFVKTTANGLGQSERAAREATATFGGLLNNLGFAREESAKWSMDLTTLASDLGSAFNMEPAEAVQAIGAALRGETEPIRRFNVMLSDAEVRAKAVEMGLAATTAEVDKHGKAQASLALIMEQTADVQGDFANTADGAANAERRFQAQLEDFKASVGQSVLPIMQGLLGGANDLLGAYNNLSPETQKLVSTTATLGTGLLLLGGAVSTVTGQVIKMRENIGHAIDGAKGMLTAAKNLSPTFIGISTAVGLAVATFAAYVAEQRKVREGAARLREEAEATGESLEQLARRSIAEVLTQNEQMASLLRESGHSMEELGRAINGSDAEWSAFIRSVSEAIGTTNPLISKLGETRKTLEEAERQTKAQAVANKALGVSQEDTAASSAELAGATADLSTEMGDLEKQVTDALSAFEAYFDQQISGMELQSRFEASLDALGEALKENGGTLDLNTEAGRRNFDVAKDVQGALVAIIKQRYEETGSIQAATEAADLHRLSLIEEMRQAGLSAGEIQHYIDTLRLTPEHIQTAIQLSGVAEAEAALNEVTKPRAVPIALNITGDASMVGGSFRITPRAHGGPVAGGRPYLVGERGPELLVPSGNGTVLDHQTTAQMLGGQVHVGQIVVNGAQDPAATAREVRRELLRLQRRNGSTGL